MPQGARIIIDNVFYHIIVRGNQRQKIFKEKDDYTEYLLRLRMYKKRHGFKIYGFCLMPNHVHILGEINEKVLLAKFMHALNRSYTAYFNTKYNKVGHLWQGRFISRIISHDKYAIECINYIEQNPVRANIVAVIYEYPWSSYGERILNAPKCLKILDAPEL